jgi:ferrochelatase
MDTLRAEGATRVLVLPLYPQYAAATTASVGDAVMRWALQARRVPELRFVGEYHDHAGYIEALAQRLESHWAEHGRGEKLVLSFHGVPERSLTLGDPYHCQCQKTGRLLQEALGMPVTVTFQSRFGRAEWLRPYTDNVLETLASEGINRIAVVCPGFAADCLETLEEVAMEGRDTFLEHGGTHFAYLPCLNAGKTGVEMLHALLARELAGWVEPPLG